MWEGFDEYSHFAFIQRVALLHDLPDSRKADTSRTVVESLRLVPSPWLTHDRDRGLLSYEEYWALPPGERAIREANLRSMPPDWAIHGAAPPVQLWEAQQPPLFYWIAAPVYWSIRRLPLPDQVWIMRLLAVLIASALVPLAFLTGRAIAGEPRLGTALGLSAALVIACMPELMMSAARIGNECLAMAMGGLLTLLGARTLAGPLAVPMGLREVSLNQPGGWNQRALVFGAVLGLALLTKAYFLAFLPWAIFLMLAALWKRSKRAAILGTLVMLVPCFAICGWWYVRTMLLTGTITGEEREVAVRAGAAVSLADALFRAPWIRVVDFLALTHIWLGGWSFLVVRSWMYRAIELSMACAIVGVLWQIAKPRKDLPRPAQLVPLVLLFIFLALGLGYHATSEWRTHAAGGTMGYYFYCLAVPEAVLLIAGLSRILPRAWSPIAAPMLAGMFLALEAFGFWFLQIPYYAGMIAHVASGGLPAFRLGQLRSGGFRTMIDHLLANKPAFLDAEGLIAWGGLFLCATGILLAIAVSRSWARMNTNE